MNTPICDFSGQYAEKHALRLHMPGHKGKCFTGTEFTDITEIKGADVLYSASGIIEESQKNASALFGSGKTLYSCEGSSLSIRAMLYLALLCSGGAERPFILACRNAHKVLLSTAALLDFDIEWLYSETSGGVISCNVSASMLDKKMRTLDRKPAAVYVTSPDYLGNLADIRGFAEVCRRHGVLLLVDNAHGAYLHFLPESKHPLDLGADMCCDSAHKTLPVLTGGAYLHISADAPPVLSENAERAMSLFSSTSPSYLILQSLDMANRYLADNYRVRLAAVSERISELKSALKDKGFVLIGEESLKLTVAPKLYGYTGDELAEILYSHNIYCEFSDPDYIVFMFTPEIDFSEMDFFERVMLSVEKRACIRDKMPEIAFPERVMTVRQAMLSGACVLPVEECFGRVLAAENVACPPAVPVVACGEKIDEAAIRAFRYYGIKECRVVIRSTRRLQKSWHGNRC